MDAVIEELNGTWEEIRAHDSELRGKRVRLQVLEATEEPDARAGERGSTGADLLKFAGTWEGDDLKACLKLAYQSRSKSKF